MGFVLNPKQIEHRELVKLNEVVLAEGGGRSGKTFDNWDITVIRAAAVPETDHLWARLRFSHIKASLVGQTVPRWFKARGWPAWSIPLNKSDWYYQLPNGSRIWVAGLDDEARMDKALGRDFATIGGDEVSEWTYGHFDMLLSRLVPPPGMRGLMLLGQNPGNKRHWTYKVFHEGKLPDGRPTPPGFARILMNPDDNPHQWEQYEKSLSLMSLAKQKRFRWGEYSDDQGSLWKRALFRYQADVGPTFFRVVVGVDPSGSVEGDEIGIVVAAFVGYDQNGVDQFTILDDYSLHGTPAQWAAEVAAAYSRWGADCVAAEKNYGGDMVEDVIKRSPQSRNMNVKLITSSRGKIVRAEPIVALYEHGQVSHRIPFLPLEDEMCSYEPGKEKSPNRMDAAVFALAELSGDDRSMLDVI